MPKANVQIYPKEFFFKVESRKASWTKKPRADQPTVVQVDRPTVLPFVDLYAQNYCAHNLPFLTFLTKALSTDRRTDGKIDGRTDG